MKHAAKFQIAKRNKPTIVPAECPSIYNRAARNEMNWVHQGEAECRNLVTEA